jgi:Cu(I)/Ag(I) efflux system membrane fusion protein
MTRAGWALTTLVAVAAAGGGGYWIGQHGLVLPDSLPVRVSALPGWISAMLPASVRPAPPPTGSVIYYRDPDGKPFYALEPKRTDDGRAYAPVHASEDVSFEDKPQGPSASEPAAQGSGKRVLYYRNPMGLPDISPMPKKDAMGMDYIPVYEGEAAEGATVTVPPGKLQRTGVRSEPVRRRVVSRPVRAPGTIQFDERRIAVVSLRSDAFIDKVENVTTGDHVRKGQPLVRVYSPEITAASAQYLSIINEPGSTGGGRPLVYEGARRRLENLNVPPDVLAEIERTRKVPVTVAWVAPRDGLVQERNAVEGMKAPAGEVLFRIADHSSIWVLADVTERDLALIVEGQSAVVRVRSYPDRSFTGRITRIYPHLNKETRTARIRIELPNPDGILRPDMYADVEVATGAGKPVVAVQDSALIDTGTRQVVLLDKGEGRFEPREVKVGARGNDYVEIRDGVNEGDRVVVSANFLIDAESNLKAALQSMAAASASPAAEEKRP